MKSVSKNIRISPKKLNLVAEMVRGKRVNDAAATLRFTPKRAAPILQKAIQSAVANAENNFKQERGNLFIQEIFVGKGVTLKRFMPVSRGRAHPILKRSIQLTIKIGVVDPLAGRETVTEAKVVEAKEEKKPATRKTGVRVSKKAS